MPAGASFTMVYPGLARVLLTSAEIAPAFDPKTDRATWPETKSFSAIWDTGATNTVITQDVVDKCGIKATGMAEVSGVNGLHFTETYLVNIQLPNNTGFSSIKVTKGRFEGGQILIGMDIISRGDFAVTHSGGKTMFSFQYPSVARIDFRDMKKELGPNERCHCGSGKKFKKCHGMLMARPPVIPN